MITSTETIKQSDLFICKKKVLKIEIILPKGENKMHIFTIEWHNKMTYTKCLFKSNYFIQFQI